MSKYSKSWQVDSMFNSVLQSGEASEDVTVIVRPHSGGSEECIPGNGGGVLFYCEVLDHFPEAMEKLLPRKRSFADICSGQMSNLCIIEHFEHWPLGVEYTVQLWLCRLGRICMNRVVGRP